jgi:hypothetical protein
MIDKFGRKKPRDDDSELEAKKEKDTPIPPSPVAKEPTNEKPPTASTSATNLPQPPVPTPVLRKSTPSIQPPVRMGEDPATRQVNVQAMDRQESTQERINRVKSGKMTDKEKAAFLETALSAGTAAESRKPLRGPEEERKRRGVASPFPSDSILRNFARGKNATNGAGRDDGASKNSADEQQKKRAYLDMVTSPDRFQRYKASAKSEGGGVSRISGSIGGDRKTYIPDIADVDLQDSSTDEPIPATPVMGSRPDGPDLGARLEAAAIANENLRQQQEEDRRKLSIEAEKQRSEQMKQNAVLEQKRLQEFARKEADVQQLKQREQDKIIREQDEKKVVELKRLEALMKAQEDYWTKKLATERGAKQALRDSAPTAKVEAPKAKVEELKPQKPVQAAAATEKPFAGPNETNLLELAEHDKEEDWAHNQDIIERKAAEISGRRPSLNDVQSEKSWMEEQTKHKSDVDRLRDEQLLRLKALNSPLPSPRAAGPPTIPPAFQQSRVVPPTPSTPARSLGNMLRSMNNKGSTEKEDDSTKLETGAVSKSEVPPPPQRSEPAPPADRRLSISELTKRKKAPDAADKKEDTATAWSNLVGNAKETQKEQPPPQQQKPDEVEPPKERKGPIRMQIPQGDGDDDDGEEDDNLSSNKSMSIADAMKKTNGDSGSTAPADQKENSKKWGVDMSRFL